MVLAEGASCVAFDFAGSGQSDGDYVTLGWNEKNDVAAVVDHIRGRGLVSSVALWGRRWVWGCCHPRRACGAHHLLLHARGGCMLSHSMGAATALLHGHRDPSIAALVLDSAFADLRQLANVRRFAAAIAAVTVHS